MSAASLQEIARALGGEVVRGAVLAPGPGHSRRDRSLSIKLSASSPDGFLCHSHAADDFRDCRDYVRERLGLRSDAWKDQGRLDRRPPPVPDGSDEVRIARAVAIWDEARDPRGTVVERYLTSRGLQLDDVVSGTALRFHPACPWRDADRDETIRVPTLIAAMRRIDNDRITAVHRTRLTPDGRKVDRRMLGIVAGTAVKLDADEHVTFGLTVGEGVETVLAARQIGFQPSWAMTSAGAVAALPVLGGVDALTLLREQDAASERACYACGSRWEKTGREVFTVDPMRGNDINDTIRNAA